MFSSKKIFFGNVCLIKLTIASLIQEVEFLKKIVS